MLSQLVIHDVPIECINNAAITYHVPATVIIAVLQVEGGKVGMARQNPNHTIDYGPMQVNSLWLNSLQRYGITRQQLQYNPCVNVAVGTWILSRKIANSPHSNLWHGIADYHSSDPKENRRYRHAVSEAYVRLTHYLNQPTTHSWHKPLPHRGTQ